MSTSTWADQLCEADAERIEDSTDCARPVRAISSARRKEQLEQMKSELNKSKHLLPGCTDTTSTPCGHESPNCTVNGRPVQFGEWLPLKDEDIVSPTKVFVFFKLRCGVRYLFVLPTQIQNLLTGLATGTRANAERDRQTLKAFLDGPQMSATVTESSPAPPLSPVACVYPYPVGYPMSPQTLVPYHFDPRTVHALPGILPTYPFPPPHQ